MHYFEVPRWANARKAHIDVDQKLGITPTGNVNAQPLLILRPHGRRTCITSGTCGTCFVQEHSGQRIGHRSQRLSSSKVAAYTMHLTDAGLKPYRRAVVKGVF